jgi:hypothetical protein
MLPHPAASHLPEPSMFIVSGLPSTVDLIAIFNVYAMRGGTGPRTRLAKRSRLLEKPAFDFVVRKEPDGHRLHLPDVLAVLADRPVGGKLSAA